MLPKAKTIGILYTQSEPNSVVQKDEAKRLLEEKGFTVVEKTILDSNNVKAAAESLMAEVDMVFCTNGQYHFVNHGNSQAGFY